jgi:hypothetical protein
MAISRQQGTVFMTFSEIDARCGHPRQTCRESMRHLHKWMTNQKPQCMVRGINKDGTAERRNASVNEAVELGKNRVSSSYRGLSLGRENHIGAEIAAASGLIGRSFDL